jgi:hypothetical protein
MGDSTKCFKTSLSEDPATGILDLLKDSLHKINRVHIQEKKRRLVQKPNGKEKFSVTVSNVNSAQNIRGGV